MGQSADRIPINRLYMLVCVGSVIGAGLGMVDFERPTKYVHSTPAAPQSAAELPVIPKTPAVLEVIAVEAPGCGYCNLFRRDVAPAYAASAAAKTAKLRFLDLNDKAIEAIRFAQPISLVPTVVVVKDGVEVARINGYVAPHSFYALIKSVLNEQANPS